MRSFYRVMLGQASVFAEECFAGGYIGVDFAIHQDLSTKLPEDWRTFNKQFIPVYLAVLPEKSKISAGLACGALWTVAKGLRAGDIAVSPDGQGNYRFGEVTGGYSYHPGTSLPHRRGVTWLKPVMPRSDMSDVLRSSVGSIGTVSNITKHSAELERFLGGATAPTLVHTSPDVEDPSSFALETHLEDFLVKNWAHTELGKQFDIFSEDGNLAQQYETDTGPLDILAISKDKKRLLVVELKKGRASDVVVGQTLRYMGFVQDELAEDGQTVEGAIIAHEDDQRIRRALTMAPAISFYRYQVSFKLLRD